MSVVGRTYLEKGEPVTILAQWRGVKANEQPLSIRDAVDLMTKCNSPYITFGEGAKRQTGSGPRNVLVRRASGELVIRPFRGLRKGDGA